MLFSKLLLVSKKNLRLKCSQCRRLLSSAHFGSLSSPSHTLTCFTCKPLCVVCGIRKPVQYFSDGATYTDSGEKNSVGYSNNDDSKFTNSEWGCDTASGSHSVQYFQQEGDKKKVFPSVPSQQCLHVCNGCLEKSHVAKTNVYFRFPILKYRSCPFSTEEYRKKLFSSDPKR